MTAPPKAACSTSGRPPSTATEMASAKIWGFADEGLRRPVAGNRLPGFLPSRPAEDGDRRAARLGGQRPRGGQELEGDLGEHPRLVVEQDPDVPRGLGHD